MEGPGFLDQLLESGSQLHVLFVGDEVLGFERGLRVVSNMSHGTSPGPQLRLHLIRVKTVASASKSIEEHRRAASRDVQKCLTSRTLTMQMSFRPSARCAYDNSAEKNLPSSLFSAGGLLILLSKPGSKLCLGRHQDLDDIVVGDIFSDNVLTQRREHATN